MTESLYPSYCDLFKGSVELARRAVIKTYEESGNIPEVARVFRTTRKTERKVVRR